MKIYVIFHLYKAYSKHNLIFENYRKSQIILVPLAFLLSHYYITLGLEIPALYWKVKQQDRGGIVPEQLGIKSSA